MNPKTMVAIALACAPFGLWAATPALDAGRPGAVAEAGAECTRRQDWTCLARLMDPAALRDLRALFSETGGPRLLGLSEQEFQRNSDVETFAAFMGAAMARTRGMRVENVQVIGGVAEGANQYHAVIRTTVRMPGDIRYSAVEATSLNKVDGRWWLQPNGDAQKMLQMIRSLPRSSAAADGAGAPKPADNAERARVPMLEKMRAERARQGAAAKAEQSPAAAGQPAPAAQD